MSKVAKFVKDLDGFTGHASLYEVDPPMSGYPWDGDEKAPTYAHVVVSAVDCGFAHETYIFGADATGKVIDWNELPGSVKGTTSHDDTLTEAGYAIAR